MDNKFNAVIFYRGFVSKLIHSLLLPAPGFSITQIASLLHITIGQCSRVYHGCCSLSPEKFLKLFSVYALYYGDKEAHEQFSCLIDVFQNGTL